MVLAMDPQYGPIPPSEEHLAQLQALVHVPHTLQKAGYIIHQLSDQDVDKKRRCQQCSRLLPASHKKRAELPPNVPVVDIRSSSRANMEASARGSDGDDDGIAFASPSPIVPASTKTRKPIIRCKFHPGTVAQRKWTCCNGNVFAPPCKGEEAHTPRVYANGQLAKDWRFYATPSPRPGITPALAVVIDCEMGVAASGESELIRVSAVDYFSRAVLLDSLVFPDVKMAHYNTRFSGVTRQAMDNARRRRTCLFGRDNARKALWKFVGPDTIVVGHAGQQDLTSLRWIHPVVVDTLIIETANKPPQEKDQDKEDQDKETETTGQDSQSGGGGHYEQHGREGENRDSKKKPKEGGGLSLKALALQRLNRVIQVKGRGHDSLEDSIATRDLLHWNVAKMMEGAASILPSEPAVDWLS